jgi:subtilase family serine protease
MKRSLFGGIVLATIISLLAVPSNGEASNGIGEAVRAAHTCAAPAFGDAACHALVLVDATGRPLVRFKGNGTPAGLGPSDLQSAYGLAETHSSGRTVAIVDAYDDPTAFNDVNVYRTQFGLPLLNTDGPTFTKVSQTGSTKSLPKTSSAWATEISLDLDMVSAACPDCNILLVEANSASFANLGAAVAYAATQPGVVAISNSYGGPDFSQPLGSGYDQPGIAVTASTGDSGYGVEAPASFGSVIAVGGTSLTRDSNTLRGWTETAWSGAGSGCSLLNLKPSWQSKATKCSGKANADVSAVADPNTGVAVYDSTRYLGASGWQVYGGTSVASPIIASVYALAGNFSTSSYPYPAAFTWENASGLNDVTSGSNGTCTPSVWCNSGPGWDGPTGLGSPHGLSGF